MRIPLDYYRILGLPLAASEEQLRQAYSDRIVQLPRREYSQAAIASRKQLIEEAYVVLSDPKERSSYDQLYLAHAYDPDSPGTAKVALENRPHDHQGRFDAHNLGIEVASEELVGALLILQELGEYELVLKLGRTYLGNQNNGVVPKKGVQFAAEDFLQNAERPDIILTVALACLELGREQWQQGHYENAAISLETGQEMLAREGLFPNVQAEIQADLYKLRPYRILELLALPPEQTIERHQGLELLQSILDDRGGIDGNGNDESGLSIDDFLRFIQQLRHYLTVAEQHKLFDAESKRPSAVASYLAVYAAIARGFTNRQPALIRHAKQMLMRLAKRQDVHLEQSLCALLLGQTEEATRVLELSQEYESLAFIREKSQDSPDLLPGLCLYAEQWLQNEVFPHFRDLAKQPASLKDYFANPQVQAYLEALPTDAEITNEWKVINRPHNRSHQNGNARSDSNNHRTTDPELPATQNYKVPETVNSQVFREQTSPIPTYTGVPHPETPATAQMSGVERTARANHHPPQSSPARPTTQRRRRKATQPASREHHRPQSQRHLISKLDAKTRLVWTVFLSMAGILVFWLVVSTIFGAVRNLFSPTPALPAEQFLTQINEPVVVTLESNGAFQQDGVITEAIAEGVIKTWLSTKASALGPNHEIESLAEILTGSALSQWRFTAQQVRATGNYRLYSHTVTVNDVSSSEQDPNRAIVRANVKEITQFYENGQQTNSNDDNLRVRYELVRQEGIWRIQSMSAAVN
ncbi:MAG TPA: DUF4101 domain-containing protein [Trichormus sp. M33_DOE_039]|nr:DUF4101 domain-containing protein [Trichormus sp. M33_DOE_039]